MLKGNEKKTNNSIHIHIIYNKYANSMVLTKQKVNSLILKKNKK